MRLNLILIVGVCLVTALITFALDYQDTPRAARMGDKQITSFASPAPDITFTTIGGQRVKLSDLRGKIVLINFWASWCAPCVIEMPQLLRLAAKNDALALIALSVDHEKDALMQFWTTQDRTNRAHADVILVHDANADIAHDIFQSFKYPETIVINADGAMIDKIVGAVDWDTPEIRNRVGISPESPPPNGG